MTLKPAQQSLHPCIQGLCSFWPAVVKQATLERTVLKSGNSGLPVICSFCQTNQYRSWNGTFESCSFCQACAVRNEDSSYMIAVISAKNDINKWMLHNKAIILFIFLIHFLCKDCFFSDLFFCFPRWMFMVKRWHWSVWGIPGVTRGNGKEPGEISKWFMWSAMTVYSQIVFKKEL